jgi:transcriptional regulator GlxA family with amidase domain
MAQSSIKVLLPIFPGFNTLDLNGPAEVLGNTALPPKTFSITVASATELTTSYENVTIKRDVSFSELRTSKSKLAEYDVLIQPGAAQYAIDAVLDSSDGGGGLLELIKTFSELERASSDRWLISICTGAHFLGAVGVFSGKMATTHWRALEKLRQVCAKYAQKQGAKDADVVRKRWVDGGHNAKGVRIASSGGISCGIDCTLWFLSERVGMKEAVTVATAMDYDWKFAKIDVTQGALVQWKGEIVERNERMENQDPNALA